MSTSDVWPVDDGLHEVPRRVLAAAVVDADAFVDRWTRDGGPQRMLNRIRFAQIVGQDLERPAEAPAKREEVPVRDYPRAP